MISNIVYFLYRVCKKMVICKKMADAEKNNTKEYICKSRSLPRQLKEISKPIFQVLKDDINSSINVIIENKSSTINEEQNHYTKYKCLKRDVFEDFYEDYIDFKSYINDILKSNFTLTNSISADDHLQKQQPQQQEDKNIEKTIKELNKKIQMLQEENNNLKQENNTFLEMLELIPEQNIQRKDFENETNWKIVKQKFPETCSKSDQTKNNEINNTPPLSNRFQNLVKPEIDFSIDRNLTEKINDFKYTQQSNNRKNIQSVNSRNSKRTNICVTEKYL